MSRYLRHIVLGLIVFIWVVPFVALLATSLRSETASKTSGFWTAFTPTELGHRFGTHDRDDTDPFVVMNGNIFDRLNGESESYPVTGKVNSVMFTGRVPDPDNEGKTILIKKLIAAGEVMDVRDGDFVFQTNGNFTWTFPEAAKTSMCLWKKTLCFGPRCISRCCLTIKTCPTR